MNLIVKCRGRVRPLLSVDKAITFSVLARLTQMGASAGTVLLIMRFLSPTEQGYYYALWNLVGLQTIFELGFSFVILQLAAHECAKLRFPEEGRVEGDQVALERLASVLQRSVKWYVMAGLVMGAILLPAGVWFFHRFQGAGASPELPLASVLIVIFSVLMFQIDPVFSFLEGCGSIAQIARMRFGQTLLGIAFSWTAMVSHHALLAPSFVILGKLMVGAAYLLKRRKFLTFLLRYPAVNRICWKTEIWGFQWKMAVSWLAGYLTGQFFTPILFITCGPTIAGRMGLSMSVVDQFAYVVLAWMSTKASVFGNLIASKEWRKLDSLFFNTLAQCMALLSVVTAGVLGSLATLGHFYPSLAARFAGLPVFVLLLAGSFGSVIVQSEGFYLRAHKKEPMLWQALAVAGVTLTCTAIFSRMWGALGAATSYCLCSGLLNVVSGTWIFLTQRRKRSRREEAETVVSFPAKGHSELAVLNA